MAANYLTTSRSLLTPAQLPHPRRLRISFSHRNKPAADPKRRRGRAPVPSPSHPAFGTAARGRAKKIPIPDTGEPAAGVRVTDQGLSYLLDGAPFEFQYSYTEAPRARPVALREAPFLPFGPQATPRPWTGRKPLPKSRKELPEFDSFVLPPPGKKGVKPVQSPGPFLAGMEPRYQAASREEVLGEPLTKEEVAQLVNGSLKTKRQLNVGRDGLTHNMLENVHAHWKRKRVCKIKCKGVCTVDMDNVCQQLEEKVGGKVIHRQGGVIFLFRGRNYNYRTRPCFPLMLWKPTAPVYPRLVKKIPDGLTLNETLEMRKRGRQLLPICKLGKNGVYVNLVAQVREAFQACDLVRVDCSGLNRSDCRKIGAKLMDLVPCILLSFEFEHILMWRGNDWKSSLPPLEENNFDVANDQRLFTDKECLNNKVTESGNAQAPIEMVKWNDPLNPVNDMILSSSSAVPGLCNSVGVPGTEPSSAAPLEFSSLNPVSYFVDPSLKSALCCQCIPSDKIENGEPFERSADKCERSEPSPDELEVFPHIVRCSDEIDELLKTRRNNENIEGRDGVQSDSPVSSCMEGLLLLLTQAIDSGRALVLDGNDVADADVVYQKSVTFARTAPRGPIFQHTTRKSSIRRNESDKHVRANKHLVENKVCAHVEKKVNVNRGMGLQRNSRAQEFLSDVVPQGTLRVDELAKLLA